MEGNTAASSNKWKCNVFTEENICKVLDEEDKSDVLPRTLWRFVLILVRMIQTVSRIQAVLCETELQEEVSDLTQPFVPHSVECPRFSFLGVSGVKLVYWNVFRSLLMMKSGSYLLNKYTNKPIFFVAHPNLKPGSRTRNWRHTNPTEVKPLTSHSPRCCTETWEWHVLLQTRK